MWNWRNRGGEQQNEETGAPEVQELLRGMGGNRPEPSPFFVSRVMTAIESRETELVRKARAWAAIPSFASRLSAIAALLLIMAGTWLWVGPRGQSTVIPGLVEDVSASNQSANQDDVFVSPAGDNQ